MKESKPDQRRAWLDLERFRSARALGQGGCVIVVLVWASCVIGRVLTV